MKEECVRWEPLEYQRIGRHKPPEVGSVEPGSEVIQAGFTNADSFTFTVTDNYGGSATATVTVAIQVDNGQSQNLVITALGNNQFLISGSGILAEAGTLDREKVASLVFSDPARREHLEAILHPLIEERLAGYEKRVASSWAADELRSMRNFHQAFDGGLWQALPRTGFQMLFGGRDPFGDRLKGHVGHARMRPLRAVHPGGKPALPKADGVLTFDKLADVYLSGTMHDEDQPVHLKLFALLWGVHAPVPTGKTHGQASSKLWHDWAVARNVGRLWQHFSANRQRVSISDDWLLHAKGSSRN